MGSLNSLYIKREILKTLHDTLVKKGEKGIELTLSINDEMNQYKQNISAYVSQSKEDREADKPRFYVGNGRTFWTSDGVLPTPYESDDGGSDDRGINADNDGLPF